MLKLLQNIPIRVKAFAASAVLFICVMGLGLNALYTLDQSANGVNVLSNSALPKQRNISSLSQDIISAHVKIFRYVSWASNGVTPILLKSLASEVLLDFSALEKRINALVERRDMSAGEREFADDLLQKWKIYIKAAKDVIDVGNTDAPMATMMLGGTDDDFQNIAADLQRISSMVSDQTVGVAEELASKAAGNTQILAISGFVGIVFSFAVAMMVGRSIVRPIQSVTKAMTEISFGNFDVDIGYRGRRDEVGQMVNAITTFRENTLRHAGLLKLREQELRTQNLRFEAALDNMSQGLSVYDGSQRLIVCNERYAQLCGLSEDVLTPGITLREVLQLRAKNGTFRWAEPHAPFDIDRALQDTLEMCTKGEPWTRTLNLVDGRIISISFQPMPDNGWVATHEDVTERQQAEARIKHLAHHDALTDLPNRLLLREQLENALASTAQSETLAVVLLDLDHFKDVNDTLGHPVGDELLKAVSTRLRSCVRQDEVNSIARLGGDEFAILQISARQPEAVTSLAQRIVEVVSAPYMFGDHQVFVGVSIGISLSPRDGSDPDQLLKNADIALYRAKAEGRNTFRFFEPEMDALTKARRQMELDLREALLREEFSVFYQPIVNLGRNEVCGLEALLRWKHPERGFVSPTEFIPVAEEMGLIIPIGEWVLRQACAEAARWPSNLKLAVNLSSIQFRSRNLVQTVVSALASSGLPAYRLELEITESVLLQNNKSNLATLHQLRGLGASISMDDFGTGHSSLSYLRSFPFDKIKIDSSFVGDMANSTDSVSIVRTIASLGNSLGITTTAEGVETQEQLEAVRAAGCTEVQGYFFSRPVPPEQIKTLLLSVGRAREAA